MSPERASSVAGPGEAEIRRRIGARGRITFAEFMGLALYHPEGGYYTRHGPGRDFLTAPRTSPAFGHLIGAALARMWRALGQPGRMLAVEPGAGDGKLARDATAYLRAREPAADRAITYLTIDRRPPGGSAGEWLSVVADAVALPLASPALSTTPEAHHSDRPERPAAPFVGCILSNELFDALPVHRLTAGGELWVVERSGQLAFETDRLSDPALAGLAPAPRPGQVLEVSPAADLAYGELCRVVARGFVLTIDYGGEGDELYGPHRYAGTLLAYRRHRAVDDPLTAPGEQDLTAHVDFGRLRRAGEAAGLRTVLYTSQRDFLLGLGLRDWLERLDPTRMTPADLVNARLGADELVRTDRLGKLRVLVQAKGVDVPADLFG